MLTIEDCDSLGSTDYTQMLTRFGHEWKQWFAIVISHASDS